eukprot:TRINITY_DN2236_c0_g1_i4.p1 TRINITY_DN2236_c0_g1~~TRINITY_DN2236_c0_g1_i4.p1  ORF type:complete len:223 (+),score=89.14 TRINITY_DN2236_c0_g1_i4:42-710(+)
MNIERQGTDDGDRLENEANYEGSSVVSEEEEKSLINTLEESIEVLRKVLSWKQKETKDLGRELKDVKQQIWKIEDERFDMSPDFQMDHALEKEMEFWRTKIAEKDADCNRLNALTKMSLSADQGFHQMKQRVLKFRTDAEKGEALLRQENTKSKIDLKSAYKLLAESLLIEQKKLESKKSALEVERKQYKDLRDKLQQQIKTEREKNKLLQEEVRALQAETK